MTAAAAGAEAAGAAAGAGAAGAATGSSSVMHCMGPDIQRALVHVQQLLYEACGTVSTALLEDCAGDGDYHQVHGYLEDFSKLLDAEPLHIVCGLTMESMGTYICT